MKTEEELYFMNEFLFENHRHLKDALAEVVESVLFSIADDLDSVIEMIKRNDSKEEIISKLETVKNVLV